MENLTFQTVTIALAGGMLPALLWLWFWLKEDKEKPEPTGLLFMTFIIGMTAVIFVLPLEKLASDLINNEHILIIIWSMLEEVFKYGAVSLITLRSLSLDEPIDYPIYFITVALGFAALENALFLLEPVSVNESVVSLLNGNLRFLGATLLHTIASGSIGIFLGLAFYKKPSIKRLYLICGLIISIVFHSFFNFFIMKDNGQQFFVIFLFLWTVTIISIFLLEKLRKMSGRI